MQENGFSNYSGYNLWAARRTPSHDKMTRLAVDVDELEVMVDIVLVIVVSWRQFHPQPTTMRVLPCRTGEEEGETKTILCSSKSFWLKKETPVVALGVDTTIEKGQMWEFIHPNQWPKVLDPHVHAPFSCNCWYVFQDPLPGRMWQPSEWLLIIAWIPYSEWHITGQSWS